MNSLHQELVALLEKVDLETVLSVVGPTATGKTELALEIAGQLLDLRADWAGIDIISADSRQVFKDLPIVSGADLPPNFHLVQAALPSPFYSRDLASGQRLGIHGLGILEARAAWSVADFQALVQAVLREAVAGRRLVILVGGTGLYHGQVFNQDLADLPGPNEDLRTELADLSVEALQTKLAALAPARLEKMNDSDRSNPRRLVRALEQEMAPKAAPTRADQTDFIRPAQHLKVACQAEIAVLEERIEARIKARLAAGAVAEVQALLDQFVDSNNPAQIADFMASDQFKEWPILTTTGVRELAAHLAGQADLETATANWLTRERQYARSQQTWWRSHQVDLEIEAA